MQLQTAAAIRLFQSTLPRGSDGNQQRPLRGNINFNPRSLAGATISDDNLQELGVISIHAPSRERLLCKVRGVKILGISIHAPSRERRLLFMQLSNFLDGFQSTLPRGSDGWIFTAIIKANAFQSTLPRGSDRLPRLCQQIQTDFNPRSLAGATLMSQFNVLLSRISIHAPSRERRTPLFCNALNTAISIHAPSRERRRHQR